MKKIFSVICCILLLCAGCSGANKDMTKETAIEKLVEATEIEIIKSGIGSIFNNRYEVYIEDELIATVTGKYIDITGDVFTMKAPNGDVIASEEQIKRWNIKFNRKAVFYDENNIVAGYLGEEVFNDFFNIGYKFHFYDEAKQEIGYTQQKIFTLSLDNTIYDMNNTPIYEIKGEIFNIVNTNFTLTVKEQDSEISVISAIFFACIINEIATHKESSN